MNKKLEQKNQMNNKTITKYLKSNCFALFAIFLSCFVSMVFYFKSCVCVSVCHIISIKGFLCFIYYNLNVFFGILNANNKICPIYSSQSYKHLCNIKNKITHNKNKHTHTHINTIPYD